MYIYIYLYIHLAWGQNGKIYNYILTLKINLDCIILLDIKR